MERLLQGLHGLLRLTAVTLQALLGFQVATLAGFGVLFGVSCAADHGVLLHSLWVLGGCRLPRRPWPMPLRACEHGVTLSQAFLLFFGNDVRYNSTRMACAISTPSSVRRLGRGGAMTFEEILDQAIAMLQRRGRLTYSTLKRQFQLDEDALNDLKAELLYAHPEVRDDAGRGLVWTGDLGSAPTSPVAPAASPARVPLAYTPPYLAEKILTSRSALEGERKQVTVLFADLKGSMELLADRDPEEARQLLDPVLEHLMAAVHRYEGTVNQIMGDGIMALFGAPIAHEDHAVRACYAALAMQESVKQYAAEVQRTKGVPVQIRVGLNAGEVVVRAIGNDLHMDYSAIGQTTHLAARMEQMAMPGSILMTRAVLGLAEGWVQVTPLGPVPVKGLDAPVEVFELVSASGLRRRLQTAAVRGL